MGNTEEKEMQEQQVLEQLLKNSEKQLFYTRITSLLALVLVAAVILCLVMAVPKLMTTITNVNEVVEQVNETIALADTALEGVTEMSQSITTMGNNMDTFISDNSKSVEEIMKKLEQIDFEGLNSAIKDLGDVVAPLANFFGKFK